MVLPKKMSRRLNVVGAPENLGKYFFEKGSLDINMKKNARILEDFSNAVEPGSPSSVLPVLLET